MIDLKKFAIENLVPDNTHSPSSSTNSTYRRIIGLNLLCDVSSELTEQQYQKCKQFILADFDYSIFDVDN